MNIFNRNKEKAPDDVKVIRDELLYQIRQELSMLQGGEGGHVQAILIYFSPEDKDRAVYEAVVFHHEEGKFKKEIQKIADDYDINLPPSWKLQVVFAEELPANVSRISGVEAGICISTEKTSALSSGTASIAVLQGEAEEENYILKQHAGRVNIGRDKKVKLKDGFLRTNDICFPGNSSNEANKFVSSQHAHIEFDVSSGKFLLFADEGGVPPNNKIKIRGRDSGTTVKLQSREVPYQLNDGDMIILGESAMLEYKIELK